ncbi:MAG TPA: hypothetical protein VK517_18300 [Cyclobacteriaceae bacterium]|nr:hypothetical protein [Cyclobacteriaceae bacterium]
MILAKEIENKIDERELNSLSIKIFRSFLISKTHSVKTIENKDRLLSAFIDFLSKYIEGDLIKNDKEKTDFLNSIDKLILQKEVLQLKRNELIASDIKVASARLGKKSQSAFSKK